MQRARRTLRNVQRDIDETRSIGHGDVGSLHIGFIGSAMLTTLPGIFRSYREAYPRVRLHLHESFTALVSEGLENGTLDAGILRDGDPMAGYARHHHPLRTVCRRAAGEPPLRQTEWPYRLVCFGDDPFVYYPRTAGARAYEKPLALCEEHGFRPQIVQEASHWLTILRLISAGFGVSIAPACVRRIASAEVVCLPLRGAKRSARLSWRGSLEKRGPSSSGSSRSLKAPGPCCKERCLCLAIIF